MTYHHFTCIHRADKIEKTWTLQPNPTSGLVWLTDLDTPEREALGLAYLMNACDRGERRFRVLPDDEHLIVPWTRVRRLIDPVLVVALEAAPGVMPRHWFVANTPIQVTLDELVSPLP